MPKKQLQKRRMWLLWPLIGLVLWGIFYLNDTLAGVENNPLNLFCLAIACAAIWALVTPIIRKLAKRFRLDETLPWRMLGLHLVFSLAFSLAMSSIMTVVYMASAFWVLGYTVPFSRLFPGTIYYFGLVKVVFYWTVIVADSALDYLERFRQEAKQAARLEKQLSEAKLRVLKAQLQPHFLFNTLHSLAALIRLNERRAALAVLVDLGDLLRMALKADERRWVPLSEELFMVEKYLSIERQRFGDRARFEIIVDDHLAEVLVPPLLLQPLVENAVRHGIEADPDADWVCLQLQNHGETLRVEVLDNGPGFPLQWCFEDHSGTGLGHTRDRLLGLYPGGVEVHVGNRPEGGGQVWLDIPKREGLIREA